MSARMKTKKKSGVVKASSRTNDKSRAAAVKTKTSGPRAAAAKAKNGGREKGAASPKMAGRREALHRMLMAKRQQVMKSIEDGLGQTLTEDQQRRLEAAMDVGDQALRDFERELGISLMEMRNRERQQIDEALQRLEEGTYGICGDCGVDISEKRLAAVPFARLCVECQTREELMQRIEKEEERD